MKILVTGGAGFIGSNFIRHLLANRPEIAVVNYDKLTYAGNLANLESIAGHSQYRFIKGDICDAPAVEAAIRGCDAVVHFAAESHVDRSIYEPAAVGGNQHHRNLCNAAGGAPGGRRSFRAHFNRRGVRGPGARDIFGREPAVAAEQSVFGLESGVGPAGGFLVRTYGFPALITRSSNNYGPFQFPEKFLPLMISNALEDQPLPIYGDGKQQRDWLHVEDNCRGILAVLDRAGSERSTTSAETTSKRT